MKEDWMGLGLALFSLSVPFPLSLNVACTSLVSSCDSFTSLVLSVVSFTSLVLSGDGEGDDVMTDGEGGGVITFGEVVGEIIGSVAVDESSLVLLPTELQQV